MRKRLLGAESQEVAVTLSQLAVLYNELGHYREAENFQR
jgi:hypothetical protein